MDKVKKIAHSFDVIFVTISLNQGLNNEDLHVLKMVTKNLPNKKISILVTRCERAGSNDLKEICEQLRVIFETI